MVKAYFNVTVDPHRNIDFKRCTENRRTDIKESKWNYGNDVFIG